MTSKHSNMYVSNIFKIRVKTLAKEMNTSCSKITENIGNEILKDASVLTGKRKRDIYEFKIKTK